MKDWNLICDGTNILHWRFSNYIRCCKHLIIYSANDYLASGFVTDAKFIKGFPTMCFLFSPQKVCSCNHNFIMSLHCDDPSAMCSWSTAAPMAEALCEMPMPTAWWCYPQVPFCTWATAWAKEGKTTSPPWQREGRRQRLWRQVGRRGQAGRWGRCRTNRGWGVVFGHLNYLMTCALCY